MTFKAQFTKKLTGKFDILILPVFEDTKLSAEAAKIDKAGGGYIAHAMKANDKFTGAHGQVLSLMLPSGASCARALMVGLGKASALTPEKCEEAGAKIIPTLKAIQPKAAAIYADLKIAKACKTSAEDIPAYFVNGMALRGYSFELYKSTPKDKKKDVKLQKVSVLSPNAPAASKKFDALYAVTQGVLWARDLVNEPPNTLYPESYAARIKKELSPLGVSVEIIDDKKMNKLCMGAALAVGKGSERPPRMVVMRWNGGAKTGKNKKDPIAFVGKGVTFDTGGISIKPSSGMDEMKMDMGGSAAVVGLMKSLALRKSKSNVVAIVGLAENMPSHNAYRPGDILTSMSGKTIEVLNTDAEGRLVLVDALTYIQQTYKPRMIIDLATLTGAIMVALGHEYCGTFVNDDTLWGQMEKASAKSGEKLWRMPLDKFWLKDTESDVADTRNLGKSGRYGGACSAAGFLEHFIDKGVHWAHMDIAGTAWRKADRTLTPKYGTGFGVRVLDQLVADYYE